MRAYDLQAYRKIAVTRERISRIVELRETILLFQTGFVQALLTIYPNRRPGLFAPNRHLSTHYRRNDRRLGSRAHFRLPSSCGDLVWLTGLNVPFFSFFLTPDTLPSVAFFFFFVHRRIVTRVTGEAGVE